MNAEVRKSYVSVCSALTDRALRSGWVLPSLTNSPRSSEERVASGDADTIKQTKLTLKHIFWCLFCKRENFLLLLFSLQPVLGGN